MSASGVRKGSSSMKCAFKLRCDPPLIMLSKTAASEGEIRGWCLASINHDKHHRTIKGAVSIVPKGESLLACPQKYRDVALLNKVSSGAGAGQVGSSVDEVAWLVSEELSSSTFFTIACSSRKRERV